MRPPQRTLLVPMLAVALVTSGCLGVLETSSEAETAASDVEADAPLELPDPEPGSVTIAEADASSFLAVAPGSSGYVFEISREPTLIPDGTQALHVWANHSNPVRDADVGYQRADEDEITWVETNDGERAAVELGPDEDEADGPAWSFYVRVATAEEVPVGTYEGAIVDSSLHVDVRAVGEYPTWDRDEPLQAENWTQYREAVGAGVPADPPAIEDVGEAGEDAVVAVVDTGINPYHEAFRDPGAAGSAPVDGVDATTGEPAVRFPADPDQIHDRWPTMALENRTLYRFSNTSTYFYSTLETVPALDYYGHGTWTAGTVLDQAPNATIVAVQATGSTLAEGVEWAAQQPWIDVVSVSWGCGYNCIPFYPAYAAGAAPFDFSSLVEASNLAWRNGKVVVASAGNNPTPSLTDPIDSPPWVVNVGGADPDRKGETWIASKTPDVVADFVVDAPAHDDTEGTTTVPGTSFAAPTVSGAFAGALLDLRNATGGTNGHDGGALVDADGTTVTNHDLREALNRTAVYWDTTEYDPAASEPGYNTRTLFAGTPINPAAPWLQMGWGYADGALSEEMAQGLLDGELPEKPQGAQAYMEQRQDTRAELWS